MSKIIDLTHLIEAGMPVFPGTEPPILIPANTVEKDGFAEKKITMYSHTGTHMDAPAHMLEHAKTLDSFNVSNFHGSAILLDVSGKTIEQIGLEYLLPLEEQIKHSDLLVIRTGWAEWWGSEKYLIGFPALSPDAALWVIAQGIKGIGIDAISIDRMGNEFPIHHMLFNAGIFVIENLTNLDQVGAQFTLVCLPLHIKNADGAPARAIAILP